MEYFDICDERGLPTGEVVERSVAHREGILHRTAHVWIIKKVEGRWQVLLQKRSKDKDSRYIGTFRTQYEEVFHGEPFRDNEVISIFVYDVPVEPEGLVLQESEVEEARYFDLLEVYEEICRGSEWCCVNPKGMKVLVEYLGL